MEIQEKTIIQNLLNQVNLISKHYDKIASLTGEKFNIFSIMSMEKNEVYTHSAIITELLNPNGNHGQGDIFLKAFIDIINSKIEREKDANNKISYLNNCEGLKEHTIKESSEIKPCGGRIDIYITNKKQSIIIENKIDAESQPDQLLRYYNYAISKYKNEFWLIYLQKKESNHTPIDLNYSCGFTENFSNINSNATKNKVIKITYENEISEWLKECLKYTVNLPIIRETINQYTHLINKITHQSSNHMKTNDLINIISSSKENINSAFEIHYNINKLQDYLIFLLTQRMEDLANNNNLLFTMSANLRLAGSEIRFYKESWKYCICFQFPYKDYLQIHFGVLLRENNIVENQDKNLNYLLIEKLPNMNDNNHWAIVETNISEWGDNGISWQDLFDYQSSVTLFNKVTEVCKVLESIPQTKLSK